MVGRPQHARVERDGDDPGTHAFVHLRIAIIIDAIADFRGGDSGDACLGVAIEAVVD
jgi:hypothetical protein